MDLDSVRARLAGASSLAAEGRVRAVHGLSVSVTLPGARIGDVLEIRRRTGVLQAEVVGFDGGDVVAMPLGGLAGLAPDDPVHSTGMPLRVAAGEALLGRVLDGLGNPLDGPLPADAKLTRVLVDGSPPPALSRTPVSVTMPTGVRAIDGLLTLGAGQRVGLFAGSGVGKSMLLGSIARGASADVVVVALVGERGREVQEFLDDTLSEEDRKRSVVVVATSDAPALERLRAAQVATAIAEHFRDEGNSVMLLVDSVTRFARAQREVGLASGEPPARRGYPPSVFAALPRLLERSGQSQQGGRGSITAVYTVLVEGGDMDEPIADEVRGILDGHIVLSRQLAARGHYPAIDVSASLSRVMPKVTSDAQRAAARTLRAHLATYEDKRDFISLGAYEAGSDAKIDAAIALMPRVDAFLQQSPTETASFESTAAALEALASRRNR
jgi:ATP synthase in type III secretion protein N